jgi:hypothetical protein
MITNLGDAAKQLPPLHPYPVLMMHSNETAIWSNFEDKNFGKSPLIMAMKELKEFTVENYAEPKITSL